MASEVTICNQALSWLAATPILTINDGTTNANLCLANYAELRDATLESAAWTFATERYQWAPLAAPNVPAYGYANKFLIPSTILRVLECREDPSQPDGISNIDWRREGQHIVTDAGVIYAKCIIQVTAVNNTSALFRQALAARIAGTLAPTITESKGLADRMWNLYEQYIKLILL